MGFKSGTVSVWKTRKSTPRENTLETVSQFFGVSKDWLAGKEVDRQGNPLTWEAMTTGLDPTITNPTVEDFADTVLKFALFGNASGITREDLEDVRDYAQMILARKARKKD